MNDDGIKLNTHGFEESLREVLEQYPGTAEKHLRRCGNKLRKAAKEAAPVGKGQAKGKKAKRLKDRWKVEVKGTSTQTLEYDLRSTAPHFGLVERGHVMLTPGGKTPQNGHTFVQGTYFFEKAEKEWEASGALKQEFDKMLDDIKKKVEK